MTTPSAPSSPRDAARAWWPSLAVALAALAAYLVLAPGVSGDRDSSEFTLALALDGVPHPTGYVAWTRAGHAFVALVHALGAPWAWAANAWSALGAATAVGLLHALAVRLGAGHTALPPAARIALPLLPVAALVLNPAWIAVATLAEVYSWHVAWALATALLAHVGMTRRAAPEPVRLAIGWGLLCGAGLAHHATALLVAVPLTVALVRVRPLPPRALAWGAAALAAVPLASLLALRAAAHSGGPALWPALEDSWASVWAHATGAQYRGFFGRFAPEPLEAALLAEAVFPLLVPGLVTLVAMWRFTPAAAERAFAAGLLVAASAQSVFALGYGVEDPSPYFLPALAFALAGYAPLIGRLAAGSPAAARLARVLGVGMAIVALALLPGDWRRAAASRATLTGLDGFVHEQWLRITPDRALVLWPRDLYVRLREYQLLRGEKPGLEVYNPWLLAHPAVRRRFFARHGFDPLGDAVPSRAALLARAGESSEADRFVAAVAMRINARSPLPVVLFEPEVPRVTVLPKPARR